MYTGLSSRKYAIKVVITIVSLLNGPARLSRKTTSQSPWRTIQAGKRQVKNNAQSNLLVICIICGSEARTLNPGTDT
jgi:hypothetical protein